MRSRLTGAVAAAVVLLGAAGCGSDDPGDPGDALPQHTASAGASESPDQSPGAETSPSAGATSIPSSYPKLELTFDLPEVTGARADVLRTMVSFERGILSTFRTAKLSPLVGRFGNPDMVAFAKGNVTYLRQHDTRFAGSTGIAVEKVDASPVVAVVETCVDATHSSQVVDGTPKPLDPPLRAAIRYTLNRVGGTWLVVSRDGQDGKSC